MAVKEKVKTAFKPLRDRIFVEYLEDVWEAPCGTIIRHLDTRDRLSLLMPFMGLATAITKLSQR